MNGEWYYGTQAQRQGPVSQAELARLASTGRLHPMVLVWTDGMPQWLPAGQMPFLFPQGMPAMAPPSNDGGALNLLLPIGRQSGLSIAAGYVGIFSLLLWIIGPVALVLGIFGMRDISAHPEKRGKGRAITGIVTGGLATIGMLWYAFVVMRHRG